MSRDVFARAVRFYDLDEGRFTEDLGLYTGFAERWGGPILELGCGTGRVLAVLAAAGHQVVGLDRSEAMLAAARERLARCGLLARTRLVPGDMRHFALEERFAWAFCAMNSLMHLTSLEDQLAALEAARRHLRPGGYLVLDLANPDPGWLLEPEEKVVRVGVLEDPETGSVVVRQVIQRADPLRQTLDLIYIYDEVDPGGTVRRVLLPLRLRYLFPTEARLLLERAGFSVEAVYGSYDLDPFDATGDRMIFVCRSR
ncbi:MAG: class I SAM-dependent methyltransferase [Anaerolineae bacterium]